MPVSINGSGSITGVSSLTQLTKLGVTGILTATDFSGPSGGAADFPNGLTATTASFSGNLSVGGVLTYDDVTNIDSVGVVTARSGIKVPDNQKIFLGTGDDLEIYHNGTNSHIENGTGQLLIRAKTAENSINCIPDGQVELYHDNSKKFETTSAGVDVTGDLTLTDTDAGSSAGPELKLYRNSASPADADYLGQIKFAGESDTGVERNYAKITGKISDASNGTEDGIIEIAHIKAGSQNISARFKSTELQLLNGTHLSLGDSQEIRLGASDDLQLWHNGSQSYISNITGNLNIRTTSSAGDINLNSNDNVSIKVQGGNETAATFTQNGSVDLYHNNSHKFSTTAAGAKVLGDAEVTGSIGIGTDDPETSSKLDVRGAVIGNSFGSSLLVTPSNALTPSWTVVSSGGDPSSVPSGLVSVSSNAVLSQGTSEQIFLDLGVSVNSVTFDFSAVLDTNFYYPGWKVSNNGSSWTNKGAVNTDSNGVITITDGNAFRYVTLRSLTNYNGGTIATVESTTTTPSADQPDTNTKINFPASDTVAVETGGTERLRITSTGLIDASSNTNAVALPQGTTAQRPTGSAPYIRKNTTNNALEYYDGTSWVEIITDYFPTGSTILG